MKVAVNRLFPLAARGVVRVLRHHGNSGPDDNITQERLPEIWGRRNSPIMVTRNSGLVVGTWSEGVTTGSPRRTSEPRIPRIAFVSRMCRKGMISSRGREMSTLEFREMRLRGGNPHLKDGKWTQGNVLDNKMNTNLSHSLGFQQRLYMPGLFMPSYA
jgi:hypothetical protein